MKRYTDKGKKLFGGRDQKRRQRIKTLANSAFLVFEALENKGWSKAEFARHLNVTPAHVTQALRGTRNIGIGTLSDMLFELGQKLEIRTVPLKGEIK